MSARGNLVRKRGCSKLDPARHPQDPVFQPGPGRPCANRNSTMFGDNEMGKIKFGRAFGLSMLAALSVMAVFAVSAQAGEAGTYFEKKADGTAVAFLLATVTGNLEVGTTAVLLSPGRNLTLTCSVLEVNKGALETTTLAEGEVTFKTCTAKAHKGEEIECKVTEPIVAKAKIKPFLHEKTKLYVTAEPLVAGGNFTTVSLTGEFCPIKGNYPITGFISAQVTTNDAVINLITASQAFSELVVDTLKFGAFNAFLIGKGELKLTGAHLGYKFGVL
jgi:hypothetical protein